MQRKSKSKKTKIPRSINTIRDDRPPSVEQVLSTRWKLLGRVSSTAVQEPVTRGNLLSAITIATTTTQVCRLFMSCRVTKVKIWQINSSATNPLGDPGGSAGPAVLWESDAGPLSMRIRPQMGTAIGFVSSGAPKQDSLARFWSVTNINETDVLFRYTALTGAIIQVDMECKINDSTVTATLGSSSGRTVGQTYYSLGSKIVFLSMNN